MVYNKNMTIKIAEYLLQIFKNKEISIILISTIPMIELRGSIPVSLHMNLSVVKTLFIAWFGSCLVVPVLLLLLKPVLAWMRRFKLFRGLSNAVEELFQSKADKVSTNKNNEKKTETKKLLTLFAFVSVPIPLTGTWSGSAIAVFMNLPFTKSLLAICAGNLVAASLMTALAYLLKSYADYIIIGLAISVVILISVYIGRHFYKKRKLEKQSSNLENEEENKK